MSLIPRFLRPILVLAFWCLAFGWLLMTLINAHVPKGLVIAGVLLIASLFTYIVFWTIKQLLNNTKPPEP